MTPAHSRNRWKRPRQAGYLDPDIDILRIGRRHADVVDHPADAEINARRLHPLLGKLGGGTGRREATQQFVGIAGRCLAAREALLEIVTRVLAPSDASPPYGTHGRSRTIVSSHKTWRRPATRMVRSGPSILIRPCACGCACSTISLPSSSTATRPERPTRICGSDAICDDSSSLSSFRPCDPKQGACHLRALHRPAQAAGGRPRQTRAELSDWGVIFQAAG